MASIPSTHKPYPNRIAEEHLRKMGLENEVKSELDLGPPPQELLDWAKEHIDEDPETRDQVLSDFRDMIYSRGDCTPHRTDDAYLLRFLRARSFVIERAHRLLVNYYDFKENNPEFFEGVNLDELQEFGVENIIIVPPYREQTGRRMLIHRFGNWDPERVEIDTVIQATMLVLELAILEQRAQILGGVAIFDLGGLCLQQAWHMTPSLANKMVQIMVTSFPMKIHAVHVINQSWLFDMLYNVFKPFLDERMKERIFFHGDDFESLHKHIDPKYLPEEYGGVHPWYNSKDWVDYFKSSSTIISELKSLGYDTAKEEVRLTEEKKTEKEKENKTSS